MILWKHRSSRQERFIHYRYIGSTTVFSQEILDCPTNIELIWLAMIHTKFCFHHRKHLIMCTKKLYDPDELDIYCNIVFHCYLQGIHHMLSFHLHSFSQYWNGHLPCIILQNKHLTTLFDCLRTLFFTIYYLHYFVLWNFLNDPSYFILVKLVLIVYLHSLLYFLFNVYL